MHGVLRLFPLQEGHVWKWELVIKRKVKFKQDLYGGPDIPQIPLIFVWSVILILIAQISMKKKNIKEHGWVINMKVKKMEIKIMKWFHWPGGGGTERMSIASPLSSAPTSTSSFCINGGKYNSDRLYTYKLYLQTAHIYKQMVIMW